MIELQIEGSIEASSDQSDWDGKDERHWLLFDEINDLEVGGGGTIDGNGNIWWQNSCKIKTSLVILTLKICQLNHFRYIC